MNAKFLVKITLATSLAFATVTSPIFVAPKTITAQSLVPYNALGLIGNNNANTIVYGQPSSSSNTIGSLVTNSTVTIIAKSASWYQILYANTTGYVPVQYINETPKPVALNATGKVVNIDSLNVRKAPHYLSAAINALPKNQTVQITGVTDLWYEVVISGIKGYVNRQYIDIVITTNTPSIPEELETPPTIEDILEERPIIGNEWNEDWWNEDLDDTDFNDPSDENDYVDFDSDENLDENLDDDFNEFDNDSTDFDSDENFDENLDETESNNTDLDFNENWENDLNFNEDEFEEEHTTMAYDSDQPIPVDKVWSVYFNNEIDESSVNTSTVALYNSANEKIDININVVGDMMMVSPNANYENDSYTLIIKNVQSANGKTMKKPLHYYFTVSQ